MHNPTSRQFPAIRTRLQQVPRDPSAKLLIAEFCGLLFGGGLVLFLLGAFAGITSLGSASRAGPLLTGLTLILAGPLVLGFYLSPQRRGFLSGIFALVCAVVVWNILGRLPLDVENWGWLIYSTTLAVIAICIELVTKDVNSSTELLGLSVGTIVGLILSFFFSKYLAMHFGPEDPNNYLFVLLLELPLLVWPSVLFFPTLLSGKSVMRGTITYLILILVLISFSFAVLNILT